MTKRTFVCIVLFLVEDGVVMSGEKDQEEQIEKVLF